ncbi:hypothetical protein O5404_05020 (plasmid) [Borrelia miyamotoi]|uniref:Lipoprotein n=1 Tax=Borrelia miyamotoi TaxID=47466 RepID=A0AAX3JP33_9SPIR|nr:hypothetical protein [Borrelia miyamotoi]WAZ72385.1 hypothetical protein O5404_05020 [Borrelia miyamotoi]
MYLFKKFNYLIFGVVLGVIFGICLLFYTCDYSEGQKDANKKRPSSSQIPVKLEMCNEEKM